MCSTEQSLFIWVLAVRRRVFVICIDFQLLSISLLSSCKLFQHRMCGVPTGNILAAGDTLQKDANWLKHGGEKAAFPSKAMDKNDSNKIRKGWQIEPFILANWGISTLTSVVLTFLAAEKHISWHCSLNLLAYKTLCLWKGSYEYFQVYSLQKKRDIQMQYSSSLKYSSWRLTACVTDSFA